MKPYSNDLRQRVIGAYHNAEGSLRKLAVRFSVSLNFVWLLLERFRENDRVDPKPYGGGQPPKIQARTWKPCSIWSNSITTRPCRNCAIFLSDTRGFGSVLERSRVP
jgi:transposase